MEMEHRTVWIGNRTVPLSFYGVTSYPLSPTPVFPANPLGFLVNQPQFLQMRQIIQQNPSLLPALLQQIGRENPQLLQVWTTHSHKRLDLQSVSDILPNLWPLDDRQLFHDFVVELATMSSEIDGILVLLPDTFVCVI